MPPKKPGRHKLIPEVQLQDPNTPENFKVTWNDSRNGYVFTGSDGSIRMLDDILDQGPPPDELPPWAVGEGWRNIAGPDEFRAQWKEEFGDKTTVNYRCRYWHKEGNSGHPERDHEVRFSLRDVVFCEAGDNSRPEWFPPYHPRSKD